jgi:hypothetical protein
MFVMMSIKLIGWNYVLWERSNGTLGERGATLREGISQQAGSCCMRLKESFPLIYSSVLLVYPQYIELKSERCEIVLCDFPWQ